MVSNTDILSAAILVVDDLDANIQLLRGMLRIAGYTSVHSTKDPTEVCELHRRNKYSLILLDLQMPGMDGFQVMKALREVEGDGYLPVIVITAQASQKLPALDAGARDFVSKPFEMAELRARVRNVLEVRLLHEEARASRAALEETVRELEATREVVRIRNEAEREKREQELGLARRTQESLLPRLLPQFQNCSIRAYSSPTHHVGGDFYDFLQLSSGEWMGVLADVSGKGIPAALLSSMVLGALGTEFRSGTRPDDVLHRVNRLLCEKSLGSQFVTLFVFLLRPDGRGTFISAGHNPAWLFRAATGKIENLRADAPVLGIFHTAAYAEKDFFLEDGDVLTIYTDGLTDAEDGEAEMLGERRLRDIIRAEAPGGAHAVERAFLSAVTSFTGGAPQTDDITFLVIEKLRSVTADSQVTAGSHRS
jgi:serine phosphatase RsbU (regulator of sigma subunit)